MNIENEGQGDVVIAADSVQKLKELPDGAWFVYISGLRRSLIVNGINHGPGIYVKVAANIILFISGKSRAEIRLNEEDKEARVKRILKPLWIPMT